MVLIIRASYGWSVRCRTVQAGPHPYYFRDTRPANRYWGLAGQWCATGPNPAAGW